MWQLNRLDNDHRGFSDSLLASRQLYTEAPSHKLSAMLYEVRMKVLDVQRNMIKKCAGWSSSKRRARCSRRCCWLSQNMPKNGRYPEIMATHNCHPKLPFGSRSLYALVLGQCKFRFMDFIMDSNWWAKIHRVDSTYHFFRYHTVDQQWDWTFPDGYPTV